MAMLAVAETSPGAVMDSTFYPYSVPVATQSSDPAKCQSDGSPAE